MTELQTSPLAHHASQPQTRAEDDARLTNVDASAPLLARRRLGRGPLSAALVLTALLAAQGCGDDGSSGGDGVANNAANNGEANNANNAPNNATNNTTNNTTNNLPSNNDQPPPVGGPNELVDHDALTDFASLAIEVDTESTGTITVGQSQVYLINFTFASINYAGNEWRHQASLYLPPGSESADLLGVVQRDTQNPVRDISAGNAYTNNYGIGTATNMGLPILMLNDVPARMDLTTAALAGLTDGVEPRCTGGPQLQPEIITRCMIQVVLNSGRADLDPFLHMAMVFSRAITATQALPGVLAEMVNDLDPADMPPAFDVQRAALFAASVRGTALPIAAAIDRRVIGVYQSASAFGALPEYFALQRESWGGDYFLGDPEAWQNFLSTDAGQSYQAQLDPAQWPAELLAGKSVFFGWGTQQTYAPLRSLSLYSDALPAETHRFLVRDYGDGLGSREHFLMWQVFLAHVQGNRPMPSVSVSHAPGAGQIDVTATVEDNGTIAGDKFLFYVSRQRDNDDLDFRDAVWEILPMEPKNNTFVASFSPLSRNTAYAVVVSNTGGDPAIDALTASQVVVVEP